MFYKIPENNLGFQRMYVSDDGVQIQLQAPNRAVSLWKKCSYSTRDVVYDNPFSKASVPYDLTEMLMLPKKEEAIKLYINNNKKVVSYFKLPDNELNFVNIGIDTKAEWIYLNHQSGAYIVILKDYLILKYFLR